MTAEIKFDEETMAIIRSNVDKLFDAWMAQQLVLVRRPDGRMAIRRGPGEWVDKTNDSRGNK